MSAWIVFWTFGFTLPSLCPLGLVFDLGPGDPGSLRLPRYVFFSFTVFVPCDLPTLAMVLWILHYDFNHQAPGLRSVPSARHHPSSEPSRFATFQCIPPVSTFSHPLLTLYPRKRSCVTLIIIRFIPNSLLPLLAPIINLQHTFYSLHYTSGFFSVFSW